MDESSLQLVLGVLINVLLVVGDDGLGDGLTDSVNLRGVTTTGDTDTDIDASEFVGTNDQERLVGLEMRRFMRNFAHNEGESEFGNSEMGGVDLSAYLEAEDLRLDQGEGLAIDLDETFALLLNSKHKNT